MPDLLGAVSVMTAVIAILYSLWYADVEATLELTRPRHRANRDPGIKRGRRVLRRMALPLLLVSALPTVVFAPSAAGVVLTSAPWLLGGGRYDAIGAAFLGVYALTLVLLAVAVGQVRRLIKWIADWSKDDATTDVSVGRA